MAGIHFSIQDKKVTTTLASSPLLEDETNEKITTTLRYLHSYFLTPTQKIKILTCGISPVQSFGTFSEHFLWALYLQSLH